MIATSVKPMSTVQIRNTMRDASARFDMFATLRETGWASDGRFMFRAPVKLADALLSKGKAPDSCSGRIIDPARMAEVLAHAEPSEPCAIDGEVFDHYGKQCQSVILAGACVKLDARFVATVRKYHPKAMTRIRRADGTNHSRIVSFVECGVIVAIIMPIA